MMDERFKSWVRRAAEVAKEIAEPAKTAPDGGSVASHPGLIDGILAVARSVQELASAGHNLASALRETKKDKE